MKIKKITLYVFCIIIGFVSCSKKDSPIDVDLIPVRDRTEQQIADKDSLIGYLETHYYNSSTFLNNLNPSIDDLIISELPTDGILPDPTNNTLLIDAIEIKTTFNVEIDYEYYILRLNQGGGAEKPNFTDNIRVKFSGNLLNDEVFDSSVSPVDFDLTRLVSGWNRIMPQFNVAESFIENGDGTISFINTGVGVMFLPSGLAFFSDAPSGIPVYSPVIFKFDLYQSDINDHDLDGVPSYLEDINNDFEIGNDDTDGDGIQDFVDVDDDGDGVLTFDELEPMQYTVDTNIGESEPILDVKEFEISRSEDAGVITINTVKIIDSNSDGIDDYLDENITINYNE
jgi:hypothetical protein